MIAADFGPLEKDAFITWFVKTMKAISSVIGKNEH